MQICICTCKRSANLVTGSNINIFGFNLENVYTCKFLYTDIVHHVLAYMRYDYNWSPRRTRKLNFVGTFLHLYICRRRAFCKPPYQVITNKFFSPLCSHWYSATFLHSSKCQFISRTIFVVCTLRCCNL